MDVMLLPILVVALVGSFSHAQLFDPYPTTTTTTTMPPSVTTPSDTGRDAWTVPGSTVSSSGGGRFCNSTVQKLYQTSCRPCVQNMLIKCPAGMEQQTMGQGLKDCKYTMMLGDIAVPLTGCRHLCQKAEVSPKCCAGHWGPDCQECPGGARDPCFGNGMCQDGIEANGSCICKDNFKGFACERCLLAEKYGPECSAQCRCVNGECSDGPFADGSCDCEDGWEGEHCDIAISACNTVTCHEHSKCQDIEGEAKCVCDTGYRGNGTHCHEWDPCLDPADNECAADALCISNAPPAGAYSCECLRGYHGDGYNCQPTDPCQSNYGGCDAATTECVYKGPGQHECECMEGFADQGTGCIMIDMCAENATLCPPNSVCSMVGPSMPLCQCAQGYIASADGQQCLGNILQRVKDLNNNDPDLKGQLYYMIRLMEMTYKETFIHHGPFTFFAVTDNGFSKELRGNGLSALFNDEEKARQVQRQHLIPVQLALEQLDNSTGFYTLEGSSAELVNRNDGFRFKIESQRKKASILKSDVIASNGVIHVMDRLMASVPEIKGDNEKTVFKVVTGDAVYSIFSDLIQASGLFKKLDVSGNQYTVFAPPNRAFRDLPEGTLDYLKSEQGFEIGRAHV